MKKRPVGFADLLTPDLRKARDVDGKQLRQQELDSLRKTIKGDPDLIELEISLIQSGVESPLDDLLNRYQWEIDAGLPHDKRIEQLLVQLLRRKEVRNALFEKDSGRPPDPDTVNRRVSYACDVLLRLREVPGKENAYRHVAKKHGVSVSVVRYAYRDYQSVAEIIYN